LRVSLALRTRSFQQRQSERLPHPVGRRQSAAMNHLGAVLGVWCGDFAD
jgi:hypothetical protein